KLSSRIEGLTKEYGTQILLTEFTHQKIGDEFVTRELDLIRVKGKNQPVAIYELIGLAVEKPKYDEMLSVFSRGLTAYKAGEWREASAVFQMLAADDDEDGPTKLFMNRCRSFMKAAPKGVWDGVYTMTTK